MTPFADTEAKMREIIYNLQSLVYNADISD